AERRRSHSTVPLVLALLEVRDGEVRYLDRRGAQPLELTLHRLDASASDASLTRPITLRAAAALLDAERQNLALEGSIGRLGDPPDAEDVPLDLQATASPVGPAASRGVAGALAAVPPSQLSADGPPALRGHAHGTVDRLTVEAGLDATGASARWGTDFAKPGDLALRADVSGVREDGALVL